MSRLLPALLLGLCLVACSRRGAPAGLAVAPPPTRQEIWAEIQPLAARYRLDPAFIYALVIAESNGDSRVQNGSARGLMQVTPAAWRAVSKAPYEPTVWDWRANLTAGVDYLAYSRSYLHQRRGVTFSYPLLLAAFHYGLDYVEARRFEVARMPVPDNPIYRQLWAGHLTPVAPPQ